MITCVPELKHEPLSGGNQFLLIACDGIWDCMTSQEGIDYCTEFFKTSRDTLSPCLETMFDKIIAADVASSGKPPFSSHPPGGIGCDNMTAVVV